MNKIVETLIKGMLTAIWFIATIVTSVILSPFIFMAWISKIFTKPDQDDHQPE